LTALGGEGTSSAPTSTAAELIDNVLQSGSKSGYSFGFSASATDSAGNVDSYIINANPSNPGVTGLRYFYTDQTGVIRAETAGTAVSSDTPIS
jgi:hypothetical protein